jgi:mRNA interferase RelE/StbE
MYEVTLNPQAQRMYNKLSGEEFNRIDHCLELLKTSPRPRGVRKISGNIYRIRAGDWRVIYAIHDKEKTVIIGKIARRSKDTYDNVEDLF